MSRGWLGLPCMKFEVGERLDPEIGGVETALSCILLQFNPCQFLLFLGGFPLYLTGQTL